MIDKKTHDTARRFLAEGRLTIRQASHTNGVVTHVRGDSGLTYRAQWSPDLGLFRNGVTHRSVRAPHRTATHHRHQTADPGDAAVTRQTPAPGRAGQKSPAPAAAPGPVATYTLGPLFHGEGPSDPAHRIKIDYRPAVVSPAHSSQSWTGPTAERTEMERPCDSCRTRYTARSPLSRYCGSRCAKRAQRTGLARSVPEPAVVAAVPSGAGAVEAAVRGALEAAGRLSAPAGQVALVLARRLDAPDGESGSGLASVAKQLAATLAAVTADVRPADDLLDELRIRRDRKLGRSEERS
jgi:hypothetical protein